MYNVSFAQREAEPHVSAPSSDTQPPVSDVQQLIKRLSDHCYAYKGADVKSALFQLTTTVALFFTALAVMVGAWNHQAWWLCALFVPLAAGLLVRLFIIQHDCGHGSFFPTRRMNDMTGRFISLLTFTPYDFWKRAHNMHHAASGNLSRRTLGGIDTLTVKEYRALTAKQRFVYRLYRNPFLLLLVGTPFYVLLLQRVSPLQSIPYIGDYHTIEPAQTMRSVLGLDIALAVVYGTASLFLGWQVVLALYLPVLILTSWIGGWLFFIQHQFEDAYWEHNDNWNFGEAAVLGSSYYDLPPVLQWFTGNIGLHHIHHLCSAIPNYRLQKCLDGSPELQDMNRMTLAESLKCLSWSLWDEDKSKMIGFRDLKTA